MLRFDVANFFLNFLGGEQCVLVIRVEPKRDRLGRESKVLPEEAAEGGSRSSCHLMLGSRAPATKVKFL